MELLKAIRGDRAIHLAIVGAGGKTSAMFRLAREYTSPVIVTTSTHLSVAQTRLADRHIILREAEELSRLDNELIHGVVLFTGPEIENNRVQGLSNSNLLELTKIADDHNLPLIIEADGARQLPLKAPAEHEPAIPSWVNTVMVVAGLSGLGKVLGPETVHRPERFSELSGILPGEIISSEGLIKFLIHPSGGLKNIPRDARKILLLNQADLDIKRAEAKNIATNLAGEYDSIVITSLQRDGNDFPAEIITPYSAPAYAVYEPTAGIILAAGESRRFGSPKALLDWKGKLFIRQVVETALQARLDPVIVVVGAVVDPIVNSLKDLPVRIITNEEWQSGQSTSIRSGIRNVYKFTGAAIFLLCDQPQISTNLLESLVELHQSTLAKIICPQVEGKRANPVLFDRETYPDLLALQGDTGGRALFAKYPITWLSWHDASITFDIDTPADYQRLLESGFSI
jgi:molybdenum cofactor cytidylyltransferase